VLQISDCSVHNLRTSCRGPPDVSGSDTSLPHDCNNHTCNKCSCCSYQILGNLFPLLEFATWLTDSLALAFAS
jgi:hypothetical protein